MRAAWRQLTDDVDTEGDEAGRGNGRRLVDRLLAARHWVVIVSLHARTVLAAVVTTRSSYRAPAYGVPRHSAPQCKLHVPVCYNYCQHVRVNSD